MAAKKKTTQLRELFTRTKIFVLPGCSNCFEARLAQTIGFEAVYMSGGRTSMGLVGLPDAGFATMTEIVLNARYMANAVDVPLLSDADTGYGNPLNVYRSVKEYIRSGVAGIHIEDQVMPKRCGYTAGKQIVELDEAVSRYRAANDARNELDPDFVIAGRTDAVGAVGGSLDEAIRRSHAYRKAGADITYIEGLRSMEDIVYCLERTEKPTMINLYGISTNDLPSHQEMQRMGISCAFYPEMVGLRIVYPVMWEFLNDFKTRGTTALKEWESWWNDFPKKYSAAPHFFEIAGIAMVKQLEEKYLSPKELEKYLVTTGLPFEKK